MATIFQQILDSESIFKAKANEINKKKDEIVELKKSIENSNLHTATVKESNIKLRAGIEDKKVNRELLLYKSELLQKEINELDAGVVKIKSYYNSVLQKYRLVREQLTTTLSTQSDIILADIASLRKVDSKRYQEYCNDKTRLKQLESCIDGVNIELVDKQNSLKHVNCQAEKERNTNLLIENSIANLQSQLRNLPPHKLQRHSTSENGTIEANVENVPTSIMPYHQSSYFQPSCAQNNIYFNSMPSASPQVNFMQESNQSNQAWIHRENVRQSHQFLQKAPMSNQAQLRQSERTIVTAPPLPSSTPDDDLFDDDLITEEIIRACDEVQNLKS